MSDYTPPTSTGGKNVTASGESHVAVLPSGWAGDGTVRGVLYLHGATGTPQQMLDNSIPNLRRILFAIAEAGFPVLGVTAAGDSWGNDAAITAITAAKTYLTGPLGAKAGAVAVVGASMGGCGLAWVAQNLAATSCFVGLTPVSDTSDIHTNNRQSLAASINSAYGGTWSEGTYGAAHNPATLAAAGDLDGLAYKAWFGASDTTVLPATVTDLAADIGGTASAVSVAGTHGTAIGNITVADVVAFIEGNNV